MGKQVKKRDDTQARILEAAAREFSKHGYRGVTVRQIAERARVNHGMIRYYFGNKEALWKEVAGGIFERMRDSLGAPLDGEGPTDLADDLRALVRRYVRFCADCPECFHIMVTEGQERSERLRWLIETYIKPTFERYFTILPDLPTNAAFDDHRAHAFYIMVGAAAMIFANREECMAVTGVDPMSPAAIETHAELVARIIVP